MGTFLSISIVLEGRDRHWSDLAVSSALLAAFVIVEVTRVRRLGSTATAEPAERSYRMTFRQGVAATLVVMAVFVALGLLLEALGMSEWGARTVSLLLALGAFQWIERNSRERAAPFADMIVEANRNRAR